MVKQQDVEVYPILAGNAVVQTKIQTKVIHQISVVVVVAVVVVAVVVFE